ncbi:NADPH:quinone oxidoreductase family protein [Peristeroidobacter soli]|uniref:NADPH:quinone oxidoreductase family protein n=1 Tax=Peristeroidobacter soli TaxID=2497877 RepID=UPI00101DA548|nr:NADPH:quinone oxidoreductase family protein [Peristeroidobacter soli]
MIDLAGQMRSWSVHAVGELPQAMQLIAAPTPVVTAGQLLVRVRACGINFADVLLCRGGYQWRASLPFTPGLEVCGQVIDAAAGFESFIDTRIAGPTALPSGGLAEFCLVPASQIHRVPAGMTDAEAAALTISYETAWFALFDRAQAQAGESVLIHAGAGALGAAAIQLARAAGLKTFVTAGGPEKVRVCRELGADLAIDYLHDSFVDAIKQATDGRGVDIVLDSVGGQVFGDSVRVIANRGRVVVLGFSSGEIPSLAVNRLLLKNCSVMGMQVDWFRTNDRATAERCREHLATLLASGALKPRVGREFDFESAPQALIATARRATIGKSVVVLSER